MMRKVVALLAVALIGALMIVTVIKMPAFGNKGHVLASLLLFLIGLYTMLFDSNLIKKVIGLNIIDTSILFFLITLNDCTTRAAAHPLPSALIYGGLAAAVSFSAFGLAMIVRLHKYYGTVDADEIMRKRGEGE